MPQHQANAPRNPNAFIGTRLLPAAAARKQAAAGGKSFFISNRTDVTSSQDYTQPIAGGAMNWYVSTSQANDPTPSNYSLQSQQPQTGAPSAFTSQLVAELQSQTDPQLTIFIHGLGNLFDDAIQGVSAFGANLVEFAQYPGLVVGFDWPSYDETDSAYFYAPAEYAFPLNAGTTSGTIRGNINGTANANILDGPCAFENLLTFLTSLTSQPQLSNLKISLVCHSEGNYLAMLGLFGQSTSYFDHVLLVAADINTGAMQAGSPGAAFVAQGAGIALCANDVTVYWTTADDILPASIAGYSTLSGNVHNPMYGGRLGLSGPEYNAGGQQSNMYSVDCSQVINVENVQYLQSEVGGSVVPTSVTIDGNTYALTLHSSYFYIPQVVQDMAAVLTGSTQASIANRSAATDPQAFAMSVNNSNNSSS